MFLFFVYYSKCRQTILKNLIMVSQIFISNKKNNLQLFKFLEPYNEDKEDCLAW